MDKRQSKQNKELYVAQQSHRSLVYTAHNSVCIKLSLEEGGNSGFTLVQIHIYGEQAKNNMVTTSNSLANLELHQLLLN